MNFFRVGVIDFFGILCPGILVMINGAIFLYALGLPVNNLWANIETVAGSGVFLISAFVICYFFGFVLRLLSPDKLDEWSSLFAWAFMGGRKGFGDLNKRNAPEVKPKQPGSTNEFNAHWEHLIQKGEDLPEFFWSQERFPYFTGNKALFYKSYPTHVAEKMFSVKKYHNKDIYNYWKVHFMSIDQYVASLIPQAEAFVRFMSGAFWSNLIGCVAGIVLVAIYAFKLAYIGGDATWIGLWSGLSILVLCVMIAFVILTRFKN